MLENLQFADNEITIFDHVGNPIVDVPQGTLS